MAFISEADRGLNNENINYTDMGPGYYIGHDMYNYTANKAPFLTKVSRIKDDLLLGNK